MRTTDSTQPMTGEFGSWEDLADYEEMRGLIATTWAEIEGKVFAAFAPLAEDGRRLPPADQNKVFYPHEEEDTRPLTDEAIAALLSGVRFEDLTGRVFDTDDNDND